MHLNGLRAIDRLRFCLFFIEHDYFNWHGNDESNVKQTLIYYPYESSPVVMTITHFLYGLIYGIRLVAVSKIFNLPQTA